MIELKNIYKTYDAQLAKLLRTQAQCVEDEIKFVKQYQDKFVLRNVSLKVAAAEIFAVIGKSGAGKSTLLRTINQLEVQNSGKVLVNNKSLQGLSKNKLRLQRRQIGIIFQDFNLLESYTVFDNVALALHCADFSKQQIKNKVNDILRLVDLYDKAYSFADNLSGGQKQRVAIARALISQPKILLCDEATSALDAESTSQILSLLQRIRQKLGITIFIITHELDVVRRICDRVAVLHQGEIVEHGDAAEILQRPQHIASKRLLADFSAFNEDYIARRNLQADNLQAEYLQAGSLQTEYLKTDHLQAAVDRHTKSAYYLATAKHEADKSSVKISSADISVAKITSADKSVTKIANAVEIKKIKEGDSLC